MERIMQDLVSIVVPVYNAAPYIESTIRMVMQQTYENWELLLVNDASEDDSAQIIEKVREKLCKENPQGAGRIHLISQERNQGAAAARNRGTMAAQGRYLAFLDADDVWLPQKLEREIAFMQHTDAAFACHSYEFGDENAKGTGKIVHAWPQLHYREALTRTIIFTSTVMFDMTKLKKEQVMMPRCGSEDTALWWQLLRSGITAYGLDEVLTIYRRPAGASLSSNKAVAVRRIWYLYRQREHLSVPYALWCLAGWAARATLRRV